MNQPRTRPAGKTTIHNKSLPTPSRATRTAIELCHELLKFVRMQNIPGAHSSQGTENIEDTKTLKTQASSSRCPSQIHQLSHLSSSSQISTVRLEVQEWQETQTFLKFRKSWQPEKKNLDKKKRKRAQLHIFPTDIDWIWNSIFKLDLYIQQMTLKLISAEQKQIRALLLRQFNAASSFIEPLPFATSCLQDPARDASTLALWGP